MAIASTPRLIASLKLSASRSGRKDRVYQVIRLSSFQVRALWRRSATAEPAEPRTGGHRPPLQQSAHAMTRSGEILLPESCFVTGTDTGVGKTFVVLRIVAALRKEGVDAVGMKPICCGDRHDAEALHRASESAASIND